MNKIPVARTVAESYRFTFGGLGTVIGLIWLPIVILTVGGYFTMVPYFSGMAGALDSGDMSRQAALVLRELAFEIVTIVLLAVVSVAITREILNPLKRPSYLRFALGPAEFRVVGGFVGLFVLMFVFLFAVIIAGVVVGLAVNAALPASAAAGAGLPNRAVAIAVLIGSLGAIGLVYVFARLGFLLVPAAVMEGGFGMTRSWQLTKGNFWRIVLIGLAVLVPITIVAVVADVAVLGPDFLNPHLELAGDAAARTRHSIEQMRQVSAHLPLMMGIGFLLAPFTYGMTFAPAAFAYRALTAKA
ncbi:MAG: hypothetical protein KGM97_02685 [Alphaproteobacteria bacterium]|nr:hypothetical protein [Alphaproteobacteria bacterium]MDE2629876.1 hypothetical protein [Alphaproteobacteria bacterium]